MSKNSLNAKGTIDNPGKNVNAAKNILDRGSRSKTIQSVDCSKNEVENQQAKDL